MRINWIHRIHPAGFTHLDQSLPAVQGVAEALQHRGAADTDTALRGQLEGEKKNDLISDIKMENRK